MSAMYSVPEFFWHFNSADLFAGMVFISEQGPVRLAQKEQDDGDKWLVDCWDSDAGKWVPKSSTVLPSQLLSHSIADEAHSIGVINSYF